MQALLVLGLHAQSPMTLKGKVVELLQDKTKPVAGVVVSVSGESYDVTSEDGSLVWEWRRSPGAGRWSTDRWPANTVVRDGYKIQWPDWAGPGRYRVEVGMEPYDGELAIPQQDGQPTGGSDHPYFQLGWLER